MRARHIPTNGSVIRALRLAYGIKLYELATDVGVTDGTLGKIETGHMNAQMQLLKALAARLNVPVQALMLIRLADVEPPAQQPVAAQAA